MVEARSIANSCGNLSWNQPPVHSVAEEPDYVNPWHAQFRALMLEHSLRWPHLADHLDVNCSLNLFSMILSIQLLLDMTVSL